MWIIELNKGIYGYFLVLREPKSGQFDPSPHTIRVNILPRQWFRRLSPGPPPPAPPGSASYSRHLNKTRRYIVNFDYPPPLF